MVVRILVVKELWSIFGFKQFYSYNHNILGVKMNLFCVSNFNWGSKGFVVETVLGQNIFGFKNLFSFLDKLVWGQDFFGKNVGSKNNRLRDPTNRDRLIWV